MLQDRAGGSQLAAAVGRTPQFSPTWFVHLVAGSRGPRGQEWGQQDLLKPSLEVHTAPASDLREQRVCVHFSFAL